jgi:hypothetical protein
MTHTLLKAGLVSLVLASPLALAGDYNQSSSDGVVGVNLSFAGFIGALDKSYTCKATVDGDDEVPEAALNSMALTLGETQDSFDIDFGVEVAVSTAINDDLGVTGFVALSFGPSEGNFKVLSANDQTDATISSGKVEHNISFAPGVTLDYGCFGVGGRFLITSHDMKIGTGNVELAEKAFQLGFTTYTSLDLDDSMSGLKVGFQYWTTIHQKSDDAKTKFFNAAGGYNVESVTDVIYNNVVANISVKIDIASF